MSEPGGTPRPDTGRAGWLVRSALRLAAVLAVAVLVSYAIDAVRALSEMMPPASARWLWLGVNGALLVGYTVLMAVPFVPGIEIGVAILLMRGADAAPWVYLATLSGLSIAFLAGHALRLRWLRAVFADLRMFRVCRFIDRVEPLSPAARLALLRSVMPGRLGRFAVRHRCLLMALALNVPGNGLIGGGGGIALVAGMSRLFTPATALVTIALAVSPVPILVMLFGLEPLRLVGAAP